MSIITKYSENNIVILDVDRTIINGTVWFRACKTPDLMICKEDREYFLQLNRQVYDTGVVLPEMFRKETLKLIERKIKNEIRNDSRIDYFLTLDQVERYMYDCARIATKQLSFYKECAEYIKILFDIYGNNLQVIFLSSGYEMFIRGVVDTFVEGNFDKDLKYQVIGSEISISGGMIAEKKFVSQTEKKKIVKQLLENGTEIIMLADDSSEDIDLFDVVKDNGGEALLIDYESNQQYSKVWRSALKEVKKKQLLKFYKRDNYDTKLISDEYNNQFINYLEEKTNKIGIVRVSTSEYNKWFEKLEKKVSNIFVSKLKESFEKLFLVKESFVYLRGKLYYYWIPENDVDNSTTVTKNFTELVSLLNKTRNLIIESGVFNDNIISNIDRLILLSILEHIKNIYLVLINMLEKAELDQDINIIDNRGLNYMVQKVFKSLFQVLENKFDYSLFASVLNQVDFDHMNMLFNEFLAYHQGMREEDNIISIYRSIKHVMNQKIVDFDFIVSFFYGGSELGYSFVAYNEVNGIPSKMPRLLNCHFSSKKEYRTGLKHEVGDYFPLTYHEYMDEIKKGNVKILLYDNNSTTFRTLKESKDFFESFNNSVYSAIVALNYDNLVDNLLGNEPYEKLVDGWENVLDFGIAEEYITAFDTWGTSEKGARLKRLYG